MSLVFYGSWKPVYVPLLMLSAFIAYLASHLIYKAHRQNQGQRAKLWLILGITGDLSILFYFKYYNFFIHSIKDLFGIASGPLSMQTMEILLPVGISFYTFQSISHTVDVFRKTLVPHRSYLAFLTFESLFPHLVAGPIQKASWLVPQVVKLQKGQLISTQIQKNEGLELILRGYVKKLLVADNLSSYVNTVFADLNSCQLPTVILASLVFTIQIYCDFSGYTDIARGLAKMMGFEFTLNFNYPYFCKNIADFWGRWHISLSSWLKEYLYIPIGGNKGGRIQTLRNLMITMILGGLWHGANYTFLVWGTYQGLLLVVHRAFMRNSLVVQSKLRGFASWTVTFVSIVFGWYLFRIQEVSDLGTLAKKVFNPFEGSNYYLSHLQLTVFLGFILLHSFEYFVLKRRFELSSFEKRLRFALILLIVFAVFLWSPSQDQAFIYFQF